MIFLNKIWPHCNSKEFKARWTAVDKDLSKLENYFQSSWIEYELLFGFNNAENCFMLWIVSKPHQKDGYKN